MDMKVNISVIIPVYNAEDTIERAVNSITIHEYEPLEVILVDDGSTDNSGNICDCLASQDDRVKVVHKENGGVSSARNTGLDIASGEYVMFLDADDAVRFDTLQMMYRRGFDMILGGYAKLQDMSVVESYKPSAEIEYRDVNEVANFLDRTITRKHSYLLNSACFKLFRLSIIRDNGIRFDEELRYGEDKMFVFTFLSYVNKVLTVPDIVYDYILQPESLSSDLISDRHLSQLFLLLERYRPVLDVLKSRFPSSIRLAELYHVDFIGRYVCRILTVFARGKSSLMTESNISTLYSYMSEDNRLGLFSLRPGQIVNILLYKIGKPSFTMAFYRFTSMMSR